MHAARTIIIGIDGADWSLFDPLITAGWLPNLAALRAQSAWGPLQSTIPPVTGAAWVSFATGASPGCHGCYSFLAPGTTLLEPVPLSSGSIGVPTLYQLLRALGRDAILINLPVSYPPLCPEVPTITSLLTRGPEFVFPAALRDEIPELSEYRLVPDPAIAAKAGIETYAADVRRLEAARFAVARALFAKRPWDLFFLLFSGTDWVQHRAMRELERGAFRADSHLLGVYRDIDAYIGWFAEHLPPQTDLVLLSDHGFRTVAGSFAVNRWLEEQGWLHSTETGRNQRRSMIATGRGYQEVMARNRMLRPGTWYRLLQAHPALFHAAKQVYFHCARFLPVMFDPDFSTRAPSADGTLAYLPSSEGCGIYLNRRSRFADGALDDPAADALADRIAAALRELRSPRTGAPAVRLCHRATELYRGPLAHAAPDIVFLLDDMKLSRSLRHALFDWTPSADHDLDGILVLHGPSFREETRIEGAAIEDVAPTVCAALGCPILDCMDGRVIAAALRDPRVAQAAQRRSPEELGLAPAPRGPVHSLPDAAGEAAHRLRSLGYID